MPLAESANSVLLKGDSFSPVRLSLRETLGTLLMIDDMQMIVNGLEYRAFQMLSKIDTFPHAKAPPHGGASLPSHAPIVRGCPIRGRLARPVP